MKKKAKNMIGYTETILKYADDDSHVGTLDRADGVGEVGLGAEEAGRRLAVRFALQVEAAQIKQVRYQVFGCGFTLAACAALAQQVEGKSLKQAAELDAQTLDRELGGLPTDRSYCADLAIEALQAALSSVQQQSERVVTRHTVTTQSHDPRLSANTPLYRALMASPATNDIPAEDRQLFACLLAVAAQESVPLHLALNLSAEMLETLLSQVFPAIDKKKFSPVSAPKTTPPPDINPQVQSLLLGFVDPDLSGWGQFAALVLARVMAARAAHPGHLWVAMGLFERPQLSAAIRRHLPALAAANHQGMRWKRFFFRQVCEFKGGTMCKSPVCGDCSDYSLCFVPEEEPPASIKSDRYVSYKNIDCAGNSKKIMRMLRRHINDPQKSNLFWEKFKEKLAQVDHPGQGADQGVDELFLIHTYLNNLHEIFAEYDDQVAIELLEQIERECC